MHRSQLSLIKWASLLTKQPIKTVKQIEDLQFAQTFLELIDEDYSWAQIPTYAGILTQIGKYYQTELGLNINHTVTKLNVYKNCMEVWQLILGMAIRGKNKQAHINMILTMQDQIQEEMMRLISTIIQNLNNAQQVKIEDNNGTQFSTQRNLLMQVAEENQQYRQKLQQMKIRYDNLKKSTNSQKKQLENQLTKFKKLYQSFQNQISQASIYNLNISYSGTPGQVIKDLFQQLHTHQQQNQYLHKKIQNLQQLNKQLRIAYQNLINENNSHIITRKQMISIQIQLDKVRKQNKQIGQRQINLMKKNRQLQQQKFNLKQIVQKIQKTNPKKIDYNQLPQSLDLQTGLRKQKNIKKFQPMYGQQQQNQRNYQQKQSIISVQQSHTYDSIRNQIDNTKLPHIKSKLQNQIKNYKQQIQILNQQNRQLREINKIFQNIIQKYTKQAQLKIIQYQKIYSNMQKQIGENFNQTSKTKKMLEKYLKYFQERQNHYLSKITNLQIKIKKKGKNGKVCKTNQKKNDEETQSILQPSNQTNQSIGLIENNLNQQKQIKNINNQQQIILKKNQLIQDTNQIRDNKDQINKKQQQIYPKIKINWVDQNNQKSPQKQSEQQQIVIIKDLLLSNYQPSIQEQTHHQKQQHRQSQLKQQNDQDSPFWMDNNQQSDEQFNKHSQLEVRKSFQPRYSTTSFMRETFQQKNTQLQDKIFKKLINIQNLSNETIQQISKQLQKLNQQHNRLNKLYNGLVQQCTKKTNQNKQQLINLNNNINHKININLQKLSQQLTQLDNIPEYLILKNTCKQQKQLIIKLLKEKQEIFKKLEQIQILKYQSDQEKLKINQFTDIIQKIKAQVGSQSYSKQNAQITSLMNRQLELKNKMLIQELNIVIGSFSEYRQMSKSLNFCKKCIKK